MRAGDVAAALKQIVVDVGLTLAGAPPPRAQTRSLDWSTLLFLAVVVAIVVTSARAAAQQRAQQRAASEAIEKLRREQAAAVVPIPNENESLPRRRGGTARRGDVRRSLEPPFKRPPQSRSMLIGFSARRPPTYTAFQRGSARKAAQQARRSREPADCRVRAPP